MDKYLVVQRAIIMEVEDSRSHASCLPWGQCITAGHHTLNSWARQRQINFQKAASERIPAQMTYLKASLFPTEFPSLKP